MKSNLLTILVICRTSPQHSIGGFEDHMHILYEGLAKKGHFIHFITTPFPENPTHKPTHPNITYHHTLSAPPGRYSPQFSKELTPLLLKILNTTPIDIIHSQSYGVKKSLNAVKKRKNRPPIIASFHGTEYDEFKSFDNIMKYNYPYKIPERIDNAIRFWIRKKWSDIPYFKSLDGIIATSNEQKHIFKSIYTIQDTVIHTIYNGIPVTDFTPQQKSKDLISTFKLHNKKTIIAIARFVSDKGLNFLIKGLALAVKKDPSFHLILIGDGGLRKKLTSLSQSLNLKDHISMPGYVPFEELPTYINLGDVFVNYTIRQNGYDLTMVEAMACEKTVITSNIGSNPTLITHNETGILIDPANPPLLANTLLDLFKTPTTLISIGKKARNTILKNFTGESMINKTEALFYDMSHDTKK